MLWYCHKTIHDRSLHSRAYKTFDSSEWIDIIRTWTTDQQCDSCGGTAIKSLTFNRMPIVIPIYQGDDVKIKWKQQIKIDDTFYKLGGLIYHSPSHFTARVVCKDGSVWYNDGIKTGRNCTYEGNINTMSFTTLLKAPNARRCRVGIYVKEF